MVSYSSNVAQNAAPLAVNTQHRFAVRAHARVDFGMNVAQTAAPLAVNTQHRFAFAVQAHATRVDSGMMGFVGCECCQIICARIENFKANSASLGKCFKSNCYVLGFDLAWLGLLALGLLV
jgi:hypothetical protein